MKKIYLMLLASIAGISSFAQTIALSPTGDGGFENGSTFSANGWMQSGTGTNTWAMGTAATPYAGTSGAFISSTGSSYTYNIAAASVAQLYRDVSIPAGASAVTLSFLWKGKGQSGADRLIVYTASTDVIMDGTPASPYSSMDGATQVWIQPAYSNSSTYTTATVALPSSLAGTTVRLIFTWQNDASGGTAPGAAIDNISLKYCSVPAITGSDNVCSGSTTTMSNSMTGGTWRSGSTTVATINTTTGIVTGGAAGTSLISYTVAGGCVTTKIITVNTQPAVNTGTTSVCSGLTTTLSNTMSGGTWSSSNETNATVDGSGVVSGIAAGTTTISYTSSLGCSRTTIVTVRPLPAAIAGTTSACIGSTTVLSDATTGGLSWTSDNTSVATITSGGVVAGISAGTANITYTLTTGCKTSTLVTVNPLPAAITGGPVCIGSSTTMADADGDGTWTSSLSGIASIDPTTGVATGIAAGSTVITYTLPTGCRKVKTLTVNGLPNAITGSAAICVGATGILHDVTTGGTWSSADPSIAAISGSGVISGVAAGTVLISYTNTATCSRTLVVTVNAAVPDNTLSDVLCTGVTDVITNSITGGTWSSSNTAVAAIVATTGIISGVSAGSATITYTIGAGCWAVTSVSVNASSAAIAGASSVCEGVATTFTNSTSGGTWTSSSTTNATVDPTTGVITGVLAGSVTITYTLPSGCYKTKNLTINALPSEILGNAHVCVGTGATLYSAILVGLTWSVADASVATIGVSSGVITGMSTGTTVASYTSLGGCYATRIVTVDPAVAPITGSTSVCVGGTATLSIGETGGYWATNSTTKATVDATTGVLTGISAGYVTVTYTIVSGCYQTQTVTVNSAPAATNNADRSYHWW
jgi:uncharacterized protein YjdB